MVVATLERPKTKPIIVTTRTNHLAAADLPEPVYTVPGFITPGLTILAGRPKLGKSWLAFGLADAVARGGYAMGKVKVDPGPVLYLALEDTLLRLQKRLLMLLNGGDASPDLEVGTECPPLDQGGLEAIEEWIKSRPGARMVIIDTWAKVRPERKRDQGIYEGDYAASAPLKALGDKHGVAIVVVHHTRKMEAADWLDSVSGSTGLTGAADTIMVLTRKRGETDATLGVTGRDIDEAEKAIRFDKHTGMWELLGEAVDFRRTEARQEILDALHEAEEPMSRAALAETLGKKPTAIGNLLVRLEKEGRVVATGHTNSRRYTVAKWRTDDIPDESEASFATSGNDDMWRDGECEPFATSPHPTSDNVANANSLSLRHYSAFATSPHDFSSPQPLPPGMKPGQRNGGRQ